MTQALYAHMNNKTIRENTQPPKNKNKNTCLAKKKKIVGIEDLDAGLPQTFH
jgi:hypothetical protein